MKAVLAVIGLFILIVGFYLVLQFFFINRNNYIKQGEWGMILISISVLPLNFPDYTQLGLILIIFRDLNQTQLLVGSAIIFIGVLLFVLPWIFGFGTKTKAKRVLTIIGIGMDLIALNLLLLSNDMGPAFVWGAGLGAVGAWIIIFANIIWNIPPAE
ncbi:MAG: hypothetical protein ACFFCM_18810, partial [Promethearchaeota archaeon]